MILRQVSTATPSDQPPACATLQERGTSNAGRTVDSSSASEWSDPRPLEAQGVDIPDFLQPFLGLDFIPFPPEEDAADDDSQPMNDDELASFEEVVSSFEASLLEEVEIDDEGNVIDDQPSFADISEDEIVVNGPPRQPSRRSKMSRRLLKKAFPRIRKLRARAKSDGEAMLRAAFKSPRRKSSPKGPSAAPAPTATTRTPVETRGAPTNAAPAATSTKLMASAPTQKAQRLLETLDQHQTELRQVQSKSALLMDKAETLESELAVIEKEISCLYRALTHAASKMAQAQMELSETHQELAELHEKAAESNVAIREALQEVPGSTESREPPVTPMITNASTPNRGRLHSSSSCSRLDLNSAQSSISLSSSHASFTFDDESNSNAQDNEFPSVRKRANTDSRILCRQSSSSSLPFMRVSDLAVHDGDDRTTEKNSLRFEQDGTIVDNREFFYIDDNVGRVIEQLYRLGIQVATDESARFQPTGDTAKLLRKQSNSPTTLLDSKKDWPFQPWCAVGNSSDVFVWTGKVTHQGFGHDWPVVKARTLVQTDPVTLVNFLLDSSQVSKYNRMSQGRQDVQILQEGIGTSVDESEFGLPGDIRILRTLNKPKLLPKTIEVLSMWCTKELIVESCPGSYVIVNRSVWEDNSGVHKSSHPNRLRSEMLLGVMLVRPVQREGSTVKACELTTITHVYSSGVPGGMAKRHAPTSANNMIRGIKGVFQ